MTSIDQELAAVRALLERRHSARAFLPTPLPHSLIVEVLDTARRAPSWCNTQPWHLDITEGAATERFRQRMVEHHAEARASGAGVSPDLPFPARYDGVYRARRLDTALRLYDAVGVPRGDRAASAEQTALNFGLFGAPHVAILSTESDLGVYGAIDCGIFLGAFLLALEGAAIASIAQAALASHSEMVRSHFGIPDQRQIVCGVSFGWEDTDHPANSFRTDRIAVDDIATWHS